VQADLAPGVSRGDHGISEFEHAFLLELAEQFPELEGGDLVGKAQHHQAPGLRLFRRREDDGFGHCSLLARSPADRPSDCVEQRLVVHRLAKITGGSGALRVTARLRGIVRGDENHRYVMPGADE